jgi:hypothetical protein
MLGYRLKALKLSIEYVVGGGAQEQIPDEKDGAIEDGSGAAKDVCCTLDWSSVS